MFSVLLTLVVVPLVAGFGTIHDDVRSSPPTYVLKPQLNVSFINFQHVFTNTLISRKQYTMSALGADPACVSHDELGSMVRNAHTAKRLESLAEQIYAGQNAATVMYMLPDEYITTRGTAIFNSACSWPGPRDHASAEPLEGGDGEYLHRVVGTEVILITLAALSGDAQRYRFTHAFREGLLHIHAKVAIDLKGANLNSNDPAGCATDSSQECFANPMGHMILVDTYQVAVQTSIPMSTYGFKITPDSPCEGIPLPWWLMANVLQEQAAGDYAFLISEFAYNHEVCWDRAFIGARLRDRRTGTNFNVMVGNLPSEGLLQGLASFHSTNIPPMVLERYELYVGSEIINNLPTTIAAVRSAFRIDEMGAAGLKTVQASVGSTPTLLFGTFLEAFPAAFDGVRVLNNAATSTHYGQKSRPINGVEVDAMFNTVLGITEVDKGRDIVALNALGDYVVDVTQHAPGYIYVNETFSTYAPFTANARSQPMSQPMILFANGSPLTTVAIEF